MAESIRLNVRFDVGEGENLSDWSDATDQYWDYRNWNYFEIKGLSYTESI